MATEDSKYRFISNSLSVSPGLDVWLWRANTLLEPVVVNLNPKGADTLRPLALTELPIDPANPTSTSTVWATIPVHHVCVSDHWIIALTDDSLALVREYGINGT